MLGEGLNFEDSPVSKLSKLVSAFNALLLKTSAKSSGFQTSSLPIFRETRNLKSNRNINAGQIMILNYPGPRQKLSGYPDGFYIKFNVFRFRFFNYPGARAQDRKKTSKSHIFL